MQEFNNKTVLITGAAQGVGFAMAKEFAQAGASLALVDVQDAVLDRAKELAAEFDRPVIGVVANLQSRDEVNGAVDEAVRELGGIDVAANVAGIFPMMSFEAQSEEDLAKVMDINFLGAMRVCQAVIPVMRKRKNCSIINIVSGAAFLPMQGYSAYCASKGALLAASRTLAMELAPDIRVNMISPGVTLSESVASAMAGGGAAIEQHFLSKIPMGVFATPEDIARAAVFLASPSGAGHITGATLQVNGGELMA